MAFIVKRDAPPTPSVIPIDAENMLPAQLRLTFADVTDYLLPGHPEPTSWYDFNPPNVYQLDLSFGYWRIIKYDLDIGDLVARAINPSTDPTNIPLSNWSYDIGTGNPVSIAAA